MKVFRLVLTGVTKRKKMLMNAFIVNKFNLEACEDSRCYLITPSLSLSSIFRHKKNFKKKLVTIVRPQALQGLLHAETSAN